MTRPEDISERAWEAAERAFIVAIDASYPCLSMPKDVAKVLLTGIARAIDAETARATAVERERWKPAAVYFDRYCQDEADDAENCVCGQEQHVDAKNFRDAIGRKP